MVFATDFAQFTFEPGPYHVWQPSVNTIIYDPERLATPEGRLGLLHEVAHGLLGHRYYRFDIELLHMETEAWERAAELAPRYDLIPDEAYITQCLDSYNRWLEDRATCPSCGQYGLQTNRNDFVCLVCKQHWQTNDNKAARVRRTLVFRTRQP